jgi:hypothetical protein
VLKVFRKNQFLRSLLLFPLALVLNVNLLLVDRQDFPIFNQYFDTKVFHGLNDHVVIQWLLWSLIVFISGALMNRYVIINRLSNTISLFPGLFYILFCSIFPSVAFISSISVGVFFFLLLLSNLFYTNIRFGVSNKIFNTGFYQGLMSVLFAPYSVFLIYEALSLNTLRTVKRIDLINLLNGTLLPIYFLIVSYFLYSSDNFAGFGYKSQFGTANLSLPQSVEEWLLPIFVILCILILIGTFNKALSKKGIQTIRKINILAWSIPIGIVFYFISSVCSTQLLMILFPALAYFISEWVLSFRNQTTAELIFILMLVLCYLVPWLVA